MFTIDKLLGAILKQVCLLLGFARGHANPFQGSEPPCRPKEPRVVRHPPPRARHSVSDYAGPYQLP